MIHAHATRASHQFNVRCLAGSAGGEPEGDASGMAARVCPSSRMADPEELAVILAYLHGEMLHGLFKLLRQTAEVHRG